MVTKLVKCFPAAALVTAMAAPAFAHHSFAAEFDAKPELEIFADDVVCGHGATAGDLEEDHVFYLRSRGIPEEHARNMLIAAFIAESFDDVADERLRDGLAARADGWLDRRRAARNGENG